MLTTVDEVIEALGGTFQAAATAGVGPSAVSNWKARKRIPADRYFLIAAALSASGKEVERGLFGFPGDVGGSPAPEPEAAK